MVIKAIMPENILREPRNNGNPAENGRRHPDSGGGPDTDARSGLEVRLFGPIEVRIGALPLPHLRSRKGLWLLALLALRGGRDVDRDWVAGTLWPDCDELHGRRSLRQTLHDLRIALGPAAWRLASDKPRTLHLELDHLSVDALAFDAAIESGDPESLERAVRLYRGPLLEDCPEEWAQEGRRQREQAVLGALETLASDARRREENGVAVDRLRAALRLDPFREDLQRALMEALAADGNISSALVAYRQYRALLGREGVGEPAEETVTLFRQLNDAPNRRSGRPGSNADSEESRSQLQSAAAPARRPLPIPLTALIGRDEDVRQVVALAAQARLIMLTGTGGVGKTRLAIQSAGDLETDFKDGAVFADLAPLLNPDLLPEAIRAALGIHTEGALQAPLDALCDYLSPRQVLLVLDNCEHLGHACGSLAATLLARCAGLKILATSRDVLGVKGETVWRVPSLAVPRTESSRPISTTDIRNVSAYPEFAAIQLFAERAQAAASGFELSRKNAISVARICGRLDGIPLAIELAAARVRAMPVEKIAERLNDRFRLVLGSRGTAGAAPIPRQQTLRASIDWSYDLLSDHEQVVLRRLSVFVGGWTLEAAEAVCAGNPVREWEVLELLAGLVEKSLVIYLPGEDRYRLLETIREYAAERLEQEGQRSSLCAKHLEHFAALGEAAQSELIGPRQLAWLDRLESDHDNIRAALAWSRGPQGDSEAGLKLACGVWRLWQARGYVAEGRAQLESSIASARVRTATYAKALNTLGILAYRQSDYAKARPLYEESLAIRRTMDDRPGVASTLVNLAVMAMEQGEHVSARALCEEGLAIYREVGNRWATAICLQNLGTVHFELEEYDAGRKMFEESLEIGRELGDPASVAYSLNKLGCVAASQQDYGAACGLHAESLAIRRELGDHMLIAVSLHDLARSTHESGDLAAARAMLVESLQLRQGQGERGGIVDSLLALAYLALDDANTSSDTAAQARTPRLFGAAEALREEIGYQLPPNEREEYRRRVNRARATMGEEAFFAAWSIGRAMTLDEAIELASHYALNDSLAPCT